MAWIECPVCEGRMSLGASGADWQVHDFLNEGHSIMENMLNRPNGCPYCGQTEQPLTGPHASLKTGKPDIDALPVEERPKFKDERASQQSGQDIEYEHGEIIKPHSEIPGTDAWNNMQLWGGVLTDTPREDVATVEQGTEIPEDPDEEKKAAFDEAWEELKKSVPVFMPFHYNVNRRHPETGQAYRRGLTPDAFMGNQPPEIADNPKHQEPMKVDSNKGGYYDPFEMEAFTNLGMVRIPEERGGDRGLVAFLLKPASPQEMMDRINEVLAEDTTTEEMATPLNEVLEMMESAALIGEMFGNREEAMMHTFDRIKTQMMNSIGGGEFKVAHDEMVTDAMNEGATEQEAFQQADEVIAQHIMTSSIHEEGHKLDHQLRPAQWQRGIDEQMRGLRSGAPPTDVVALMREISEKETPAIAHERASMHRGAIGTGVSQIRASQKLWEDYITPIMEAAKAQHSRGNLSDEDLRDAVSWYQTNDPFGNTWDEIIEGARRKASTKYPEIQTGRQFTELPDKVPQSEEEMQDLMQQAMMGMIPTKEITRLRMPELEGLEQARSLRLIEQSFQRQKGSDAQQAAITDHLQRTDRDPQDEEHRAAAMGELIAQEELYEPPTELD